MVSTGSEPLASVALDPVSVEDHTHDDLRRDPFVPNALLGDWMHHPISLRERSMLWLMNEITDDPDWRSRVNDPGYLAHRRSRLPSVMPPTKYPSDAEIAHMVRSHMQPARPETEVPELERTVPSLPPDLAQASFTDAMFDYCVRELRDKAAVCERQGHDIVGVFDSDAVVFKRTLPSEFSEAVKAALAPLEAEALAAGDYRPDHGYVALPLANSTLYPVEYGRTRGLDEPTLTRENCIAAIGTGTTLPVTQPLPPGYDEKPDASASVEEQLLRIRSRRFAWLPTDVEIRDGKPRLAGYINNVHPQHEEVYEVVEQLLHAALPSFVAVTEAVKRTRLSHSGADNTVVDYHHNRKHRIPWLEPSGLFECKTPLECRGTCRIYPRRERFSVFRPATKEEPEKLEAFALNHPILQPEPGPYENSQLDFKMSPTTEGRWFPAGSGKLQIIVQINNHHLTPDNPSYAGGQWHIEGMVNEHIVASAIYYYDIDNITESRLSIGARISTGNTDPDDHGFHSFGGRWDSSLSTWDLWVRQLARKTIYGDGEFRTGDKRLGGVRARAGRMVVFPNVLEHKVDGFELVDKTRPGHRKMVAIFLVDPALSILSTSRVPPQQAHWADKTSSLLGAVQESLPPEITHMVLQDVPCPYDIAMARKLRDEFLEERSSPRQGAGYRVPDTSPPGRID